MQDGHPDLSSHLSNLSSELRTLDLELKADGNTPDKALLQEFRQTMDDIRLTAWTVAELMNARETNKNPAPMLSFLASERMRRLSYMIRDLCADMDKDAFTWQSTGVQSLSDAVLVLQSHITRLIARHRGAQKAAGQAG